MVGNFLKRYFPPNKMAKLMQEISVFIQKESETLFETFERFKDLLRRFLDHDFISWMCVYTLYNRLNYQTYQLINIVIGGSLSNKYPNEAKQLFEDMARNKSHLASKARVSQSPRFMQWMQPQPWRQRWMYWQGNLISSWLRKQAQIPKWSCYVRHANEGTMCLNALQREHQSLSWSKQIL